MYEKKMVFADMVYRSSTLPMAFCYSRYSGHNTSRYSLLGREKTISLYEGCLLYTSVQAI